MQFADYSSIFMSGTSFSAISKILNDEMMNICGWLKSGGGGGGGGTRDIYWGGGGS